MLGTVVVTASEGSFPGFREALAGLPVAVELRPLVDFAPPLDWSPVDAALADLDRFAAIALTSPRSAEAFGRRAATHGVLSRAGGRPQVWAAGPGTERALGTILEPVHQPNPGLVSRLGAAAALAEALLDAAIGGPVLFPCGDHRRDELPARLRAAGVEVEEVVCYRTVLAGQQEARTAAERATVLVVASPSVADLLARACPPEARPALLAVGPTTAESARASGWTPAGVAPSPTADSLASAVRALLRS